MWTVEVGESTSFSSGSADLDAPFANPPAATAPAPKTALEAAVASSVDPANIVFLTSLLPRAIVDRLEG